MGELGTVLANTACEIHDGAAAASPVGFQAGRGVPLFQRGLIALGRARADEGALDGTQV